VEKTLTSRFQKNAEKWGKTDPKHAVLLPYCEDEDLKFCETQAGEPNLVKEGVYYHSQAGALKEAEEWFSRQDLEEVAVLYLYGVGLGYFFDVLKPWLSQKRKRHLVFLEDDLSVIYRLFETGRGSAILKHPKVHLCYFDQVNKIPSLLEVLMNHYLKAKICVGALPYYEKRKIYSEVCLKVLQESVGRNALFDEYLRYGAAFYRNFYQNMRQLADSYLGNNFFGKFKGVPAIICGAGPSLEKNAHLLEELGDRALIFAGGSAMNALNAKGIIPHFGAGIDPNAMQYDRLSTNTAYEVPYFYRNRMFWKAFNFIHGPRLYITGSGGYDVSEYFDQAFGWEEEELDEGHNVINFCVEIATRMGCHPIIFVGVDLAFTEMQAYAEGVVDERGVAEMELFSVETYDEKPILRKDLFDKPVYTLWKWVAESEWISQYAQDHPLIAFLNATEGGIGFPGVRNLDLEETMQRYLHRSYDLFGKVHGETQNSTCPQVTKERVEELMRELATSLRRCLGHLDILMKENLRLQEKVKANEILATPQSGLAVLAETELEEEPAYAHVLEVFSGVSAMLLNYEYRKIKTLPPKKQDAKRLKLNERKLKYVRQAAAFNLALLEDALEGKGIYA
jgi:hypothetical protein